MQRTSQSLRMCFNSFNKSLYKDKMLRKQYIIQKGMSSLKQQK